MWDTLVSHSWETLWYDTHSCGALLQNTLVGHSCTTLWWETLVRHSCLALLRNTLVGHSCLSLLWETLVGHSAEQSCRTLLWDTKLYVTLVERARRTLWADTVVLQVCKTSVTYETSSAVHARSHANPNVAATFTSTTTRNLAIPCACHGNLLVHTSNAHKAQMPRNVISATPRNLTTPSACHENCTSTPQSPQEVLHLPRKVTTLYYIM